MDKPQTANKDPFAISDDEPKLAKVMRSSDVASSVKEWKLKNFAEPEAKPSIESLSAEVLQKMQTAMQPQLQQQTELLKKEAYDEAFNKGYEEGLSKGLEEGKIQGEADAKSQVLKKLEPKLADFDEILNSLTKPYQLLEQKLYGEMVELALHIAKTVISKEIASYPDWALQAIEQAVAQLPDKESGVQVFLNPEDLAFIQISKPTLSDKWTLNENPHLSQGSCLVKQDHSSVLNDWKTRFDEISQQILDESQMLQPSEIDEPSAKPPVDQP